ncbi:MAG: FUSC family protein [Francisellaceae bacterium]
MQEKLVAARIWQIVNLFAVSIFIYQFTQWPQALWIPITIMAITGPFKAGLTTKKAFERALGTTAGLLITMIVLFFLHYNYTLLFLFGIVLTWCVAFSMSQPYKYFIMFITIIISINFAYLNIPGVVYNETSFITNRGMGVLVGIILFLLFELVIYRHYNTIRVFRYQLDNYRRMARRSMTSVHMTLIKEGEAALETIDLTCRQILKLIDDCENFRKGLSHQPDTVKKALLLPSCQLLRLLRIYLFYLQRLIDRLIQQKTVVPDSYDTIERLKRMLTKSVDFPVRCKDNAKYKRVVRD